ncbi:MAG: tRNA preQ1(34) S-adenosylmethionine ribosyltransferase-isomerase QueA [Anaerolineales bacterium]
MKTSDFDYNLPPESIAQTPVEPRDASRLLVLKRDTGSLEHTIFRDIGSYLNPGDLLVINRTRVIPARIFARKPTGGRVEILLLQRKDLLTWECLVGGKGLTVGKQLIVESDDSRRRISLESPKSGDFRLRAEIVEVLEGSRRRLRFAEPIEPYFSSVGHVPLPPYIHEPLQDPERYQTVYAREPGSAAAPTAGLHFTPSLIDELKSQGVNFAEVLLHVGLDTFAPVTEDDPEDHQIHTEWCQVPPATVDAITRAHQSGGRIIAVGTTSVRTLESAARAGQDSILSYSGPTNLYILPGYQFKLVDAMITNFHLPKSTLIMLVSAFAGRELILHAYDVAMQQHYRFYSFGDAMFIY